MTTETKSNVTIVSGLWDLGRKDRGFMHSIYFRDPLGLLIELACYRFSPPANFSEVDVLKEAHKIKIERKDANINEEHLADAIENLISG